jgi:Ulp1 family protease
MWLEFVCKDTPQQQNGVDCGVYVIQLGEKLLSNLISSSATSKEPRETTITTTQAAVAGAENNDAVKLNYGALLNDLDTITPTSITAKRQAIRAEILERAKLRTTKN